MNKKQALAAAKRAGIDKSRVSNLENTDVWLITHGPDQCAGQDCPIHKRSNHTMRKFPQHFRWDRGIIERICPHGIGHPDPDQRWFFDLVYDDGAWAQWVHGCDGCCGGNND